MIRAALSKDPDQIRTLAELVTQMRSRHQDIRSMEATVYALCYHDTIAEALIAIAPQAYDALFPREPSPSRSRPRSVARPRSRPRSP